MKLHSSIVILFSLLLSSISFSATAGVIELGTAMNYNAFIYQDFSATSSDVEGRMAVGGNVSIGSYSVNIKDGKQLYSDTSSAPALVVGGDLNYSSGQIAGDVYVGGNYTPTSTGSVTNGTVQQGTKSPVDFDAEFDHLMNLSTTLSTMTANGAVNELYSSKYLVGSGKNNSGNDVHVFNLDASDMLLTDYFLSDVDQDDTVIFNVSGTKLTTSWGNFGGSDNSLRNMSSNIIFNFFEAEEININASLHGSILAPKADIVAQTGVFWGQVVANSWSGNMQINDSPFVSRIVKVPEPSSLLFFALGLFGLALRNKRAQKI